MNIVTVLLDYAPGVWIQDDGTSQVPTNCVGTGSNGGAVGQIFLHAGANPGVSDTAVRAFTNNTSLGQSIFSQGLISTTAA